MLVTRRSLLRAGAAVLLAAQCLNAAPALAAVAPAAPATKAAAKASPLVTRAQSYYREARYDEAVGLLAGPVLRKELAGDDLRDARVVLARCYVKKGLNTRAKEYFGAVLAADPAWTADAARLDDEERAVFDGVKAAVAPPAPAPVAAKTPESKPSDKADKGEKGDKADKPKLHKPDTGAPAGPEGKPGWLARNKFLAIGLVVAGGVGAGLAAGGGGGGGGSTTPPGPNPIPGFPSVPGGH